MEGIREETLSELFKKFYDDEAMRVDELETLLMSACTELDPWITIEESVVDNKEYLFITRDKKQRVDRFHPRQYATKNTELRWQERPGDRYTHYKELSQDPKD